MKLPAVLENYDRHTTYKPTDRRTHRRAHREVSLAKNCKLYFLSKSKMKKRRIGADHAAMKCEEKILFEVWLKLNKCSDRSIV